MPVTLDLQGALAFNNVAVARLKAAGRVRRSPLEALGGCMSASEGRLMRQWYDAGLSAEDFADALLLEDAALALAASETSTTPASE